MWIFVMFDLPVGTKKQRDEATGFRNFLLDKGFEMCQFSVYARFCSGKQQYEAFVRHIQQAAPERGDIHILAFTDKQYEKIIRISGQIARDPKKNPNQLALF